jgi:phosphatidylserine decarboxylase
MESYIFKYHKTHLIWSIIIIIIGYYYRYKKIAYLLIFYILFCYYFFRIPKKMKIDNMKSLIYSPAYGKIINIKERGEYIQIGIFINITDPHIQYAPTNCYLEKMIYKKGVFSPAFLIKSENNERMEYHCTNSYGKIIFSQIAGTVARTIVPFIKEKRFLKAGEEIGLIKFGSRSDIIIPKHNSLKIFVKEGDYVEGGKTLLARYFS